jgi:Tol biopolymer transport system component
MFASGCASLCAVDSGHQVAAKPRGEGNFAPDSVDDAPPTVGPPQNVNVFGEVNGNRQRAAFVVSEAGFQQHTFTNEGFDSAVSVDPTGKWLAFASTRNSEHPSIYLQRVDGTAVTQLTSDSADDAYPVFSPDGKQVAFSSTRTGTWQIYVMDLDGHNITQVTSGTGQSIHPSFSPDGSKLVYCSLGSRSGQWELWTVNLKTNEKRMIGNGLFPTWSPDKSTDRIAFQRARQRGSRWFSLWTMDLVGGEGRHVTEVAVSTNAAIISPAWNPDGKRLAFTTVVQPTRASGTRPKGQTDIWVIDADGANRQRITDGRATNLTPYWAPDNRIYFISDRGGAECVWSVHADVQNETTVVKESGKKEVTPAVGAVDTAEVTK